MKKTKRKKNIETRKHKALRRALICLGVLVIFSVLHLYTFTPMQGVRQSEAEAGTGQTYLIRHMGGEKWNERDYMTANENAILITRVTFYPLLGWSGRPFGILDCADGGDFQATSLVWRNYDDKANRCIICGRLRSREVMGIRAEGHWDEESEKIRTLPEVTISGGPEIWTEKDGWRYFFAESTVPDTENGEMAYPTEMTVTTLDKAGNPLRQYKGSTYERFIPVDEPQ
ncbi:hypothetical protein OBV_33900 [Oscillibacter valericigenes Sjm18-20]|nr:hypothetical protein OBV_33900 [Oscillibacter valericigenes Sjm18-20]